MKEHSENRAIQKHVSGPAVEAIARRDFVTMTVMDQVFGIPVLQVRDVLAPQRITRIPLAQPEVAGSLNLRGHIVTAIDVRRRMGLPPREDGKASMSIVVDNKGELYSLLVDSVGEVLSLPESDFEENPPTMDERWRGVSQGIYRLDKTLLVILDITRLMTFLSAEAA
ncbi:MAG: chemotaxis protein CheW [Alphaproteobacteria bacterium]|nr:MAG: chemotaxis protein CheW [Alphaproteobacteria bacterium]